MYSTMAGCERPLSDAARCGEMADATPTHSEDAMPIQLSHDHVAIRAVDYAGTLAWYQDKLDFTIDQEWPFGDMQLAYLSNGTAKVEILGGSVAEPHPAIDSLDDSFGVEEYHHFCVNVADVDATLAELRGRGVEVLGDAIDLDAIGRRLGFFKDNSGNIIELASPLR
jgi:catechol 2,3-dioxygenase-like lactoylglutathione lyase family enzyme